MTFEQSAVVGGRVVVGVDGSEPSRHALRWARFLARASASTLEVVAAWQRYTPYGWYGAGSVAMPPDNPADDTQKAVTATIEEVFGDERPAGFRLTVRAGHAAQVLLEVSEGAWMLVVGSRGHGGFTGLLLGSVSAGCAEHATCPVLVCHGDTEAPN